jgi:large repetitive protein
VNGSADVTSGDRTTWNRVDILNNVIVNNGVGVAGGGISLQDAANVNIVNNTIAMNDSYGTASRAFQGSTNTTQAANCASNPTPGCLVISESTVQNGAGIAAYGHSPGLLGRLGSFNLAQQILAGKARFFSDAQIINSVVEGNRSYHWKINYAIDQTTCAYETANGNPCFGLIGPATPGRAGNDIAVLYAPPASVLLGLNRPSVSYTVVGNATGFDGSNNVVGDVSLPTIDFASAYVNGSNGALRQLLYSLEQSIVIGAPVLEVQEPTVATTAAAFDEGGNFIDVRFGPLTRGAVRATAGACGTTVAAAGSWCDFGSYNPTVLARTGNFGSGLSSVTTAWPKLGADLNGVARSNGNFVRGALAQ